MKSEVTPVLGNVPVRPYPKLMVSERGRIILALSEDKDTLTGVIVGYTNKSAIVQRGAIGSYHSTFDVEVFEDFNDAVTLSN